ncbi:MAG: hypothetical protein DRG30_00495 [Epsilonproteobacteria bacterium]|nr:MAG: hypothetical protein DRG30_00495 [Campylobacterota bacterium]
MNEKNSQNPTKQSKEALLADIEQLMQYDKNDKATINPSLLTYLDIDTLISTKKSLLKRTGTLSEEDKEWLHQFMKYNI